MADWFARMTEVGDVIFDHKVVAYQPFPFLDEDDVLNPATRRLEEGGTDMERGPFGDEATPSSRANDLYIPDGTATTTDIATVAQKIGSLP